MALSDLAVFSEYAYDTSTEVLSQQVDLFNAASQGAIILADAAHVGDFSEQAMWAKISGLVRRRNAYGTGDVGEKTLAMLTDTMVKVASATPPVRIDPGMFEWIQKSPEEAGVIIGQQLAGDTLADMLNTSLLVCSAAITGQGATLNADVTGTGDGKMAFPAFNTGQRLFGDAASEIAVWAMHSTPLFDIYGAALANSTGLFTGSNGNVQIRQDPFGRLFVVTDSPSLVVPNADPALVRYKTLGLVRGAVRCERNNDFTDNIDTNNGKENIVRTYQAEWSYSLAVKGFAWDKTNGGKSPTDAALGTSTNWDRYATSGKDMAGIAILSK